MNWKRGRKNEEGEEGFRRRVERRAGGKRKTKKRKK